MLLQKSDFFFPRKNLQCSRQRLGIPGRNLGWLPERGHGVVPEHVGRRHVGLRVRELVADVVADERVEDDGRVVFLLAAGEGAHVVEGVVALRAVARQVLVVAVVAQVAPAQPQVEGVRVVPAAADERRHLRVPEAGGEPEVRPVALVGHHVGEVLPDALHQPARCEPDRRSVEVRRHRVTDVDYAARAGPAAQALLPGPPGGRVHPPDPVAVRVQASVVVARTTT